jgi:hypothetical protein
MDRDMYYYGTYAVARDWATEKRAALDAWATHLLASIKPSPRSSEAELPIGLR